MKKHTRNSLFALLLWAPLCAVGDDEAPAAPAPVQRSKSASGLIRSKSVELKNRVVKKVRIVPERAHDIAAQLTEPELIAWASINMKNATPTQLVALIREVVPADIEEGVPDRERLVALRSVLLEQLHKNRRELVGKNSAFMSVAFVVGVAAFWWSPGSTAFFQNTVVPISTGIFVWGCKQMAGLGKTWIDERRLKHH